MSVGRQTSRIRGSWVKLALQLLAAPWMPGQSVPSVQAVKLEIHRVVAQQLRAGTSREYRVEVRAGQVARLAGRQMGVHVVITVLDPLGKTILAADRPNGALGLLTASFIAEISGEYRVRMTSASGATGRYRMELAELRDATQADGSRIQAETIEFQAERERQTGTRESRLRSIELFERAGLIWKQIGDAYEEGLCLDAAGRVYSALGETQKALDLFGRALPLFRAAKDRPGEATTLSDTGLVYFDVDEEQKALEYCKKALLIFRVLGDRSGQAAALSCIGTVYESLDERPKALKYLGQALALFRAARDQSGEATALRKIGGVYDDLDQEKKALEFYNRALPLHRAVGDRSGEAVTLDDIGSAYSSLDDEPMALKYFNQALSIHRAVGDRQGEADTLLDMGAAYYSLDEDSKALDYFNQALPIYRAVGSRSGEADALHQIANVYWTADNKEKALEGYGKVLALSRAIGDREGEATALVDSGDVYRYLGDKQKALEYFNQALPIYRAIGSRSGEGDVAFSTGRVYAKLGETEQALRNYSHALALRRSIGERLAEADTLRSIGNVYADLGEKLKAMGYYSQALPICRATGDRSNEAATLGRLRAILEKSQPYLAIVFGKQAVNVLQSIRRDNRGLDDSLRKSFEQSIESDYRSLAGLLVDQQRFGEAEEVLNLLKDKEASDFIRRDALAEQLRAATLLDSERKALERYEQILGQIVSYGEAKTALVGKAANKALDGTEAERSRKFDRDLAAANTVLLRFLNEEEKAFPANSGAAKRVGEMRESEGLQDTIQALGPDVVAIYTLVLPHRYTALLVTSGTRKAYSTAIQEKELNRKIFSFRRQLQDPRSNPLPLAQELYKILFPEGLRQDLDRIGAQTIMWSIDSTVRYVPLAALHDGQQYLVTRFRNSLITPASLTRLTEGSQTVWQGVGFGVSAAQGNFAPLPAVPVELGRIFRPGESGNEPVQGEVRLDQAFTLDEFQASMRRPQKALVHVATHFDSRPGVAANSHLLLGDGSQVSLAEIQAMPRLFSGVDLLTLSACNTAFENGNEDGREVDSFGTIAQRLGARSVIASLWSVNDAATSRLMETMYRIRQSTPELGKSEALRQAQEQMAQGILKPEEEPAEVRSLVHGAEDRGGVNGWTHPYFWAPFILIGNWK